MRLNSYIEKILKSEHIEIKRNFYERKEHEEWNEKVKIVQQLCDSDDVQFEVSTKFILTENGLQCESEERVVPVFKTKVDPLDNLKKILSKVGINPVKNTMYESIENHKWEKNVDLINNMIDADDFDFDVSTDMIFTEDNFKYESEQIIVPVMSKMEEKDASLNNNMMIMLNIDSVSYKEKPDKKQVGAIQKRIGGCKRTVTVEEFIQAIENGASFKSAALNGNKNADWESQQVFALDIDNDEASIKKYGLLTPEEACNRFSDLGVSPVFYYSSFSSTEERPKFRLIFIVKNPITDIRVRNAIQMALMNIMPEADKACKDLSRLCFGTNKKCEVIYNQKQLLDPYMLIQSMVSWIKVNLREIIDISSIVANDNGEVLGMTIRELPNKKCIILSATANENIYRSLFPNREIRFIDISNIETEGEIILHYTGFSRNKLSKEFEESIVKIRQETKGINNVITFCKFENKFKKAGFNPIAHFGACSGLDVYKGQDLIVVGTPHADERVYRLLAAIIEGEVENHQKISYTNAKKNGFEFYFNTYESGSLLQEIQFYFIESELIQAIGRARILRTDSKVHVFSNYPVRGEVLYEKKIS